MDPGITPSPAGLRPERAPPRTSAGRDCMAAGVGKTYRMLLEGRAEQQLGHDVVIGLLETHGRAETASAAEGLEVVPRRPVQHRGTQLDEMDLPGDPRARTRDLPGRRAGARQRPEPPARQALRGRRGPARCRHRRALDAERPAPGVAQRPGRGAHRGPRARNDPRRVPRTRGGDRGRRPHPGGAARAPAQRQGLSGGTHRRGAQQLLQDREPRGPARGSRCGRWRRRSASDASRPRSAAPGASRRATIAADAPRAVSERLLALVQPNSNAQRLVRRAWRAAQRQGTELDLLWVRPPRGLDTEQERSLTALRHLASILGANLIIEESDDLPQAIAAVARRQHTTYILMGRARPARGLARLRHPCHSA